MTRSTTESAVSHVLRVLPEDRRIAALAAAAVGLSVAEAAIPLPLPGLKPGLANIVTLVVLVRFGWRVAAWVTLLRVVASALALGSFLTPTFLMSLTGGIASLLVLAALVRLPGGWVGAVGLSVLAALAHMSAQLLLVDLWLLPGVSLAGLLPVFLAVAWLTGLVNGLVAARLIGRAAEVDLEAARA
jgi:heptaprenyl diphosphate synthase